MSNIDPAFLLIMIPIFDLVIYPALRKARIRFTPIKSMPFPSLLLTRAIEISIPHKRWNIGANNVYRNNRRVLSGRHGNGLLLRPSILHIQEIHLRKACFWAPSRYILCHLVLELQTTNFYTQQSHSEATADLCVLL